MTLSSENSIRTAPGLVWVEETDAEVLSLAKERSETELVKSNDYPSMNEMSWQETPNVE